jgi:hypothetical protein
MEAATPLRQPRVTVIGDRLVVDGLVVEDEVAVRLVREREGNGENPAKTVSDALEIGARVLDREQAAANAEFVKTEFERAARQLDKEFTDKARTVAEHFGSKVDEVFGPENGRLARELDKLFSDGSSTAVQHRIRELVGETLAKSREDLVRQFSAADGTNPLAEFKAGTIRVLRQADERQHQTQQALLERLAGLEKQLQGLRDEKDKLEAVDAERERGTAKGRTFEESVAEAVDSIAMAQGDVAEAVGDLKGATGKTGDVVVAIDACNGPSRGRIVIEAKDRRLTRPAALAELDRAREQRDADFAVLVVPGDEQVPARLQPLREYNGDKLIAEYDPEDGSLLSLEVAYRLARARVLMTRGGDEGVDLAAAHDLVERALAAMEDVRRVKSQLTGAKTSIDNAYRVVEEMAARVRGHLEDVDAIVLGPATGADGAPAVDQLEL